MMAAAAKRGKEGGTSVKEDGTPETQALGRRHLRFGWWALLAFLTLGLVLEGLHGLKIGWYLSVAHETRRLMWTLAHAHGTLLAVVNLVFAALLPQMEGWAGTTRRWASISLLTAALLMPLGFLGAGLGVFGGDPGPGIVLVLPGGLLLFFAVFLTARGAGEGGAKKGR